MIDAQIEDRPARLGRLAFRAWRRGFREADLVLGPFVEARASTLSDTELNDLERLLAIEDDHRLYAWITGAEATPADFETPVLRQIRAFMTEHVAGAVAQGAG